MISIESTVEINPEFRKSVEKQQRLQLIEQGEIVAGDIARSFPRRGRQSLPGETPTSWNDKLRDITVTYDSQNKAVLVYPARHGSGQIPAELEFGTSAMAPRPYLRPAFERNVTKIINGWRNAIK